VSSPELDLLVELARRGGAAGARLTGAGFGGCIVALAGDRHLQGVLGSLEEGYYGERSLPGPIEDRLFVALPSAGASVRAL
jgi:galactokinase